MSTATIPAGAARFLHPQGHVIDGRVVPSTGGATLPVEDPATGEIFATIPAGGAEDIDRAVRAARASFVAGAWSRADPAHRGRVLWAFARAIRDEAEALAWLETRDSGKPIAEARADIVGTAEILEYYAGLASQLFGQTTRVPGNSFATVIREPAGVVGQITPWNFPLYVGAWKFAPALCSGCSVVLKPSELTSLTMLAAAELALAAGVPPGVFNVVCGTGSDAGAPLASHPHVDVLAFTGGVVTGRKVLHARADLLRPTQLELGGKSPNIVFDDADLERASAGAAFGIFYNQGENCNAGSRLLVQAGIYERFVARLVERARAIRVLPPLDERSQMGALISAAHARKVADYVEVGLAEGAKRLCGGPPPAEQHFARGHWYLPTVLAEVKPEHRVFQEEIFGPVVTITKFTTDDEAIALANATEFGLAAGAWTGSVQRALRCTQELQSGYVWINNYNPTPVEVPFGGVKSSGFGRDCGPQAVDTYTTWKTVLWALAPFDDWYQQ
ncbi:aldehyde dehydrogenase family protein [Nannocystis bainbridge]|uniref:Aldehyde dehydrogenase family protein n=1 Tax=Nannocystis bainbridge TaxID=2995303 RepID=A0ABT5E3I4_9BACT|nr:aldehyde dehydrogenase family protein [Nannocystis bainbridge]MDC0720427.1 aldehyde dehydrogenase family protein [Nannocystis bainbridge]